MEITLEMKVSKEKGSKRDNSKFIVYHFFMFINKYYYRLNYFYCNLFIHTKSIGNEEKKYEEKRENQSNCNPLYLLLCEPLVFL